MANNGADRSSILFPLVIPLGDDFSVSWPITETVEGVTTNYDETGATITTGILDNGTEIATDFTAAFVDNLLTVSLTDAQITTIGATASHRWYLKLTKDGLTTTVFSGPFIVVPAEESGRRTSASATATYSLTTVTGTTLNLTTSGGLTLAAASSSFVPITASVIDPARYGAIGDGASHAVSTLIPGTYATLAALREARWSGCRVAADDGVVIFDPKAGSSTLYVRAGTAYAHVTYNSTTGALTLDSSSGITGSTGVMTGTTGVDGAITISCINSLFYVENRSGASVAVVWSEAETTDEVDWLAIQHACALARYGSHVYGGIVDVQIQAGVYLHDRPLYVYSNTRINNSGHHKLTGGNALGGFVFIQAAHDVEIFGGIWDSNEQGNDNTISVGYVALNQAVIGAICQDIKIHHLTVQNARHGGSHLSSQTDPGEVGRGGGKGFTAQFGAQRVLVHNVTFEDCDIGFSIEGKEETDATFGSGGATDITVSDCTVRGSRYIGTLISGDYNTQTKYGLTVGINLHDITYIDCCAGVDAQGSPVNIANNFGIISTNVTTHIRARGIVMRNTTGIVTALRGSFRYSDIQFTVDAVSIKDVINGRKHGGYSTTDSPSLYNNIDATVLLNGAQAAGTGYLCTHDAAHTLQLSEARIRWQFRDGGSVGDWAGARLIENQANTTRFDLLSMSTGSRIIAGAGYVPVGATGSDFVINGVGFDDDANNALVRIIPRASRSTAIAHSDGTAGILVNTAAPSANDATAMQLRWRLAGSNLLSAVTVGVAGSGGAGLRALCVPDTTDPTAAFQPLDSDLTAIAALTTTSYGRAFLALADAAAARVAIGFADAVASDAASRANLPTGALAQTCPRIAFTNNTVLGTGRQSFQLIWLTAGTVVSAITLVAGTTALSVGSNQWFTLSSSARVRLGITADDTSTAWAANTAKTLTLAAPYTVLADGYFYIGAMVTATTPPTLIGPNQTTGGVSGIAPIVCGFDNTNTGLTNPASAPATAAALTAAGAGFYAYVS